MMGLLFLGGLAYLLFVIIEEIHHLLDQED
jgi:hypothetical protein